MPTQEPTENEQAGEAVKPNRATRRATAKAVRATLKSMLDKKPVQKEVQIVLNGEQTTLLFASIGAKEWDVLAGQHKPTKDMIAEGAAFHTDTFPPALLARVCIDPAASEEDWLEIWESGAWSRGELAELFNQAYLLCSNGFDIPFSASA